MSGPDLGQPLSAGAVLNGMSIDVEDWFQVSALAHVIARGEWEGLDRRVAANCDRVLALFDEAGVKATFFTLGWVAEKHPAMMRRIAAEGHEIASHGWDHKRVFTMDKAAFAEDIARARRVLEDASGCAVIGYRAPSFSIGEYNQWAFEAVPYKPRTLPTK